MEDSHTTTVRPTPCGEDGHPPPVLDIARLDRLVADLGMSSRADLSELALAFVEQTERLQHEVRAALAAGQMSELARLTHALGGSARQIGAPRMAATCLQVEALALADNWPAALAAAEAIAPTCGEAVLELRAFVTGP